MLLQNNPILSNAELKKPKKYSLQQAAIHVIYGLIGIIFILSFIYSQKVLRNIEEKKKNLFKLEQTYHNIALENEKLDILLTEIQNKNYQGKYFIKLVGSLKLKKEAEKIIQDYKDKDENLWQSYSKMIFWMILGIIILGIARFLYLDYFQKKL